MKKQINPSIKAQILRSAFILLALVAVSAIPFALAQSRTRGTTDTSGAARTSHPATLLPIAKAVLAAGIGTTSLLASAAPYAPATETWTATGSLSTAREFHTATLLPN